MPGSSTTPGHPSACDDAFGHVAFRYTDSVGTRNQFSIAAQWLACTFPYRRFADILADACARLGADVVRYSFIVVDLHHLLLAGLPAHLCENPIDAMIPLLNRGGMMKGFVQGADRQQTTLLPECLDDWVDESNPVRAVDVFVDALELRDLGFDGVDAAATGRPGYHPSPMLKLYIYGYLNRVQSSRRLEREAGRNLEVMWLTGRLVPDHKTIADFRKDNGSAIKKVCAQFVALCRKMGLLAKASVAIDGSKFKAVNSRDNNFTKGKMERRLAQIEESVARYLSQLDTADRQTAAGEVPSEELAARTTRLKEKLSKLEEEVKRLKAIEKEMLAAPDQQISFTDPDSRSMATSGRGSGMVGYNVQAAVDTTNHLIVAHEVTNVGTDKSQLANMANQAKAALEAESLEAFADRGYFKGEEILACEEARITVMLPKPQTSDSKSEGRFGKQDFRYVAKEDIYICPAGEKLAHHFTNEENGLVLHRYWTNACRTCALKAQCTKGPQRRITRWENEYVVDAVQARLDKNPDAMRTRRETVEHPFGTLKMRMGATHFLMKTLPKVATEMALHVLAYNLTRVLNLLGIKPLLAAIRA
jgi:transposase